ncbi:MAG: BppU family phage baseplate upper protein [Lachnospiraceae bacterium]|nr:BppU family phage baseplate upper protein [Lachnospiraceae bacterium]
MNLNTQHQKLILDFNQKGYNTVIAKQYDKGSRFIPIQCTDNGKVLPLDSSYIVQIKMITPDQRAILNTVPIQEDGSLLLELTESMLFYPGKAKAEIRIYDTQSKLLPDMSYDTTNSKLLSTMQFTVLIEPSVFDDDRIIDSDEFNALTELIEKANADYTYVLETAQASADAAQASESNAQNSETHAAASAENAANSASIATEKAAETAVYAANAAACETTAAQNAASAESSALQAQNHATEAASYAHGSTGSREGEDSDNAQYYYLQSKSISESLAGANIEENIAKLQTDTKRLREDVTVLQNDVSQLGDDVEELTESVQSLDNRLTTVESIIENWETEVVEFSPTLRNGLESYGYYPLVIRYVIEKKSRKIKEVQVCGTIRNNTDYVFHGGTELFVLERMSIRGATYMPSNFYIFTIFSKNDDYPITTQYFNYYPTRNPYSFYGGYGTWNKGDSITISGSFTVSGEIYYFDPSK